MPKKKHQLENDIFANLPAYWKDEIEADRIAKKKSDRDKLLSKTKRALLIVSNIILWICAVGGFVLSLIQFLGN